MAAGVLPQPGTEFGPCAIECGHIDCEQTRDIAKAICPYCKLPIGYGKRFYRVDELGLVHAACHEYTIEKEMRARYEIEGAS